MTVAAAFVLAFLAAESGQDTALPSAAVRGLVVNAATQAPVADALVTLVEVNRTVKTGADGRFAIDALRPGSYNLSVSSIGFIFVRRSITITGAASLDLTIPLAGGTGTYEESIKVTATTLPAPGASVASLNSAGLQGLRTVAADDPLRAVQALPGVATANDFKSEFSVRGSAYRQVGVVLDGTATPLLLHTVQAAGDTGSIAVINTDLLAGATLSAGTHPQRHGDWLGATLDFDLREGSRDRAVMRGSVSGTSASTVAEGPLGSGKRGSWLASFRKSYIDWLVRQIDPEVTGTLGFIDTQGKAVYDLTGRQQLQFVLVAGRTLYREPAASSANEIAHASSTSVLAGLALRSTYSRVLLTHRLSLVTNQFRDIGAVGQQLAVGRTESWMARSDVAAPLSSTWRVEGGLLFSRARFDETLRAFARRRGEIIQTAERDKQGTGLVSSLWAQATGRAFWGANLTAGARGSNDSATHATVGSPWVVLDLPRGRATFFAGGSGAHQIHSPEILSQIGGTKTVERAWLLDAGLRFQLTEHVRWTTAGFGRREANVLRRVDEPRLGNVLPEGDTTFLPYQGVLDGRSRGVDLTIERHAANGLNGWLGYTWAHTRYEDRGTHEVFDGDLDQRHTFNAFAEQRLSYRLKITAKLRVGSNTPIPGYFTGTAEDLHLGDAKNLVRLPMYSRLDLGGSRTFTYRRSRLTLFIEVVNALARHNVGTNDGVVHVDGTVEDFTKRLIPIVPSAGLLLEF